MTTLSVTSLGATMLPGAALLPTNTLTTGLAVLILAAVFPIGGRLDLARRLVSNEGLLLSLSGGVSIAYVFVHMMPEMGDARETFATSASVPIFFRGISVYFVAMVGFMVYYGLGDLRRYLRSHRAKGSVILEYRIHLAGSGVYIWMISYLLVNRIEKTPRRLASIRWRWPLTS